MSAGIYHVHNMQIVLSLLSVTGTKAMHAFVAVC